MVALTLLAGGSVKSTMTQPLNSDARGLTPVKRNTAGPNSSWIKGYAVGPLFLL